MAAKVCVYVLGAGGHGKVVVDTLEDCGYSNIVVCDNGVESQDSSMILPTFLSRYPVISESAALSLAMNANATNEEVSFIIAIGNARTRRCMTKNWQDAGLRNLEPLIHPTAYVSKYSVVGKGSVVFSHATIQTDAEVGEGCIVNSGAIVDHEAMIGDYCHICPGAVVTGGCRVGHDTWIGAGASVRHQLYIGSNVTVGVGAAVINNITDDVTVVGVPAKRYLL